MFRAWRFSYPGFDLPADDNPKGLDFSGSGGVNMVDDQTSIRQSILLLLSTRPGERLMRPAYGCDIHQLIFSPNDDTTAGLAVYYVKKALARWEPRIEVLLVDANRDATAPEQLVIDVEYRIRQTQQTDTVTFSVNVAGENA